MHEEMNRVVKKPPYKELDFDSLTVEEQSKNWWQYNLDRDNSIITDLFTGQLMNRLECNRCRHKSYAFDNFMDLSVSIPRTAIRMTGQIDLKACMETYIKPEKME
jgi:ubiquitin C-terminal hydrolase